MVKKNCLKCNKELQNKGLENKTIKHLLGESVIKRGRSYCPDCDIYIYPLDFELNLSRSIVSKRLAKSLSMIGIFSPFKHTKQILKELLLLDLSETLIEQVIHRIGNKIYDISKNNSKSPDLITEESKANKVLYLQADGAMAPILTKKGREFKENKLGVVFSDKDIELQVSKNGKERIEIKNKRFVSSIGKGTEEFKKMLYATAIEKGFNSTKEVVFISDGASWLSNLKDKYLPDAVHILDWYHAVENLWTAAHSLFGDSNKKKCEEWIEPLKELLWDGKVEKVIQILTEQILGHKKFKYKQEPLIKLRGYFVGNKNKMKYAEFRDKGYHIGSGAIESANKYIMQNRVKQTGMRWTFEKANSIIWLRCKYFEDRWDEFWKKLKLYEYLNEVPDKGAA